MRIKPVRFEMVELISDADFFYGGLPAGSLKYLLEEFLPVFRWCLIRFLLEEFIEIGEVLITGLVAHVSNGQLFIMKQFAGMADSQFV